MKTRMDFMDEGTDFMLELSKRSLGLVKQGLQQASAKVAKQYKIEIAKETPSEWGRASLNGKGYVSLNDRKDRFGDKHSDRTGKKIISSKKRHGNIKDHVTFYVPPHLTGLYAVVGGGHKSFQPRDYKNGVDVGAFGKRQTATSKETLAILTKLDQGEKRNLSGKQRRALANTVTKTKKGTYYFRNWKQVPTTIEFEGRFFVKRARQNSRTDALATIKKLHDSQIQKAANSIVVKPTRIAV